jgi:hypothetical protein
MGMHRPVRMVVEREEGVERLEWMDEVMVLHSQPWTAGWRRGRVDARPCPCLGSEGACYLPSVTSIGQNVPYSSMVL